MKCYNCQQELNTSLVLKETLDYGCPNGCLWFSVDPNNINLMHSYQFFVHQNNTIYKISSFNIKNLKGKLQHITSLARFDGNEYQIIIQIPKINIPLNDFQPEKWVDKLKTYLVFS